MSSPFLFDWVLEHAAQTPEAPALGIPGSWLSYRELSARMKAFASAMAGAGVRSGDRVLVALTNTPAAVVASLAIQYLGACAVEVNREWGAAPLVAIAKQIEARHAVGTGRDAVMWGELHAAHPLEKLFLVHGSAPPPKMVAALKGLSYGWLHEDGRWEGADPGESVAAAESAPAPVRAESAPALLVYTSGSTGTPRGVIQTHRNIAANTRSIVQYLGLTAADRAMAILPLYYCYGKSVLQTHFLAGASVFLDHRFMYPRVVLEAIGQEQCTGFAGVPLTFELIKRQVDPRGLSLGPLRYLTQAGGPMHPETIAWVRDAFAPAKLFVMYGQTEATARLSYLPPEESQRKAGSIGKGIPGVELRIVDEQGNPLPAGETGQLIARGENVMPGYFKAPEETAEVLKDGWLWTGDLGHRDEDGFIFLTGRAKEILKVGGHRVSPVEIEQCLAQHPAVLEAGVVGMPDEVGGEAICAFVVKRPDATVDESELKRHCRETLPVFKVPKVVRFIDALPRTSSGKLARGQLKERV